MCPDGYLTRVRGGLPRNTDPTQPAARSRLSIGARLRSIFGVIIGVCGISQRYSGIVQTSSSVVIHRILRSNRRRLMGREYVFNNGFDFSGGRPVIAEMPDHMFYMIMWSTAARDGMIQHLKRSGIMGVFHHVPLHESPMGQRLAPNASCPVTSQASSCLLRLPFYNDLSESDQSEVLNAIQHFDAWKDDQVRATGEAMMAR